MHRIERVPTPAPGDDVAHPWVEGIHSVDRVIEMESYGHLDFINSVEVVHRRLQGSTQHANDAWVLVDAAADSERAAASDVLGYAWAGRPLLENLAMSDIFVAVLPEHRRAGHGTALLRAAGDALLEAGRTTWLTWAFAPGPVATGDAAVPAASGTGAVPRDLPHTQFLLHHRFTLEQAERPSTLQFDDTALARAAALGAEAEAVASDYELVWWQDLTPPEFADGMADLQARMSTDAPTADLDFEPETWDADRLRVSEERQREFGFTWVTTAARHRTSGALAAFTALQWSPDTPAGVWQENTLVHGEHRGRRLGMAVKAANLARLREVNPDAARVHTWNASENAWMLAINDALGFQPTGIEGAWRRRATAE